MYFKWNKICLKKSRFSFVGRKSTLRIKVKNMTIKGKGAVLFQENQNCFLHLTTVMYSSNAILPQQC